MSASSVVLITRDGSETGEVATAAWCVVTLPDACVINLTVRHPSGRLEQLDRQEGDPHPDDGHWVWPSLGLMGPCIDPPSRYPTGCSHCPKCGHLLREHRSTPLGTSAYRMDRQALVNELAARGVTSVSIHFLAEALETTATIADAVEAYLRLTNSSPSPPSKGHGGA